MSKLYYNEFCYKEVPVYLFSFFFFFSVFTYLMSKKEDKTSLCPSLTKLLNQSADHDVIEAVILLLLALSHQNR